MKTNSFLEPRMSLLKKATKAGWPCDESLQSWEDIEWDAREYLANKVDNADKLNRIQAVYYHQEEGGFLECELPIGGDAAPKSDRTVVVRGVEVAAAVICDADGVCYLVHE
ncbi:hypothetical protein SAMN05421780_101581 [Flexibacter flexilis DSM 6793]|uniref:Uncharacterized protein n=1 Tax=Flexibacter flexilis DSM 6793 TaxID=927664 RepID=A0A1I1E211_9BACT|nr:hypothetical protein [Flexibacter flexilis]SFB81094.1 hypothetical protein SAMN05421780_101581 [Flexibacter flexilis DSM 6793]